MKLGKTSPLVIFDVFHVEIALSQLAFLGDMAMMMPEVIFLSPAYSIYMQYSISGSARNYLVWFLHPGEINR